MSKAIRDSIRQAFGFEEICINSALVSAQNRQRYYWVGRRNDDGTYSKVDVQQPEDRGILLKDILDNAVPYRQTVDGKGFCLDASYTKTPGSPATFLEGGHARANRSMAVEPVNAQTYKSGIANLLNGGGHFPQSGVAEPVRVGTYPGSNCPECDSKQYRIYHVDGKAVTLCGQGGGLGAKTGLYACPVNATAEGKAGTIRATCYKDGIRNIAGNNVDRKTGVAEPVQSFAGVIVKDIFMPLAVATGWDCNGNPVKARSGADGKEYTVYPVEGDQITIKGKAYSIKLVNGFYIIRKLTVSECKRLQTVPEWYEFPVSDTQAYKMLGNGWTVDVIAHLIWSLSIKLPMVKGARNGVT